MTTTSTHDTKRGEDVRARITVLAELPDVWEAALDELLSPGPAARPRLRVAAVAGDPRRLAARPPARPARAAARLRREGDARGRRPHHVDRARRGVRGGRARRRRRRRRRRPRCSACCATCASTSTSRGWSNALALKLLALTVPGVPDVYQGSELWETSPRRPRQPASGRLRPPRTAVLRRHRLRRRRSPSCTSPAPRCACAATAPSCSRLRPGVSATGAGGRPRARLRPWRRDHRRHPAAGRSGRARRLGRHRASTCRDGTLARPADRHPRRTVRLADLLAVYPVALLVKED